jgi:serine protease
MESFRTSFGRELWLSVIAAMLALVMTTNVSSSESPVPPYLIGGSADLLQSPVSPLPTDQIIIKYKVSAGITRTEAAQPRRLAALSRAAGMNLTYFREMSGDAHVLKLPARMPEAEVSAMARKLMALPEVEYAEPDRILQPGFWPNDPQFTNQWGYSPPFGINAPAAWDITTGSSGLVVAVIDTGILGTHPDIAGRTVPGYDFISDVWKANDGDGRDPDPSDPGDWVAAFECGLAQPLPEDSSWHGTHVAGTIGAASNNSVGVSGVNWNSLILPVRVLGKCGGVESDIADAIWWAAGASVPGVPANANPARVLNLSLGGPWLM